MVLPSRSFWLVSLRAFLQVLWSSYSMKAFPLETPPADRSLHLVRVPKAPKNSPREFSSVSKESPCTKSSVFPVCSSWTSSSSLAAAVSSTAAGFSSSLSESLELLASFLEALDAFLTGLASESESEPELESLAALVATFLAAGFSSESLESSEESFLTTFLAAAFLGAGFSSEESESEEESFLTTFLEAALAAAFLGAGFSSEESESEEDSAFLSTFLSFLATTLTDSSEEESSEDESAFLAFLAGTACFSAVFLDLFLVELALLLALLTETLELALTLLATTGLASEESESEELDSCLTTFF